MTIHPTAIVDRRAELDASVEVGAYAIIEADVRIGAGTRIWPHAYVARYTTLGARCQVHPFAVVGHLPQDVKYRDAPSYAEVGDDTVVREHATIHRATEPDSRTIVGARCLLMSTAHVAHNCVVADDVIMANGALLGGHTRVGPRAFLSGNCAVHQFTRVGELAMIGGGAMVVGDVPPFMTVLGRAVVGLNVIGMRRAGVSAAERDELRRAFQTLYRGHYPWRRAVVEVTTRCQTPAGRRLADFLGTPARRGFLHGVRPLGQPDAGDSA
ncbi:MAG: acyl-ACP--UDP-N-acetylglucosamine O-acyltransferase [Phycisphaerae bacterium]|nr:acyl-ACP--UDP-N-acetylglucosamine O-acyltransferase [Phycisphaerae bacterium]MCZ2401179.1 acyl-ACP--UDP-N-acetylglucosamine O-acyltransferase [Phycisphaerae bacterium]